MVNPEIQAKIIAQSIQGKRHVDIAREFGVHRNTVRNILCASGYTKIVEDGKTRALSMIPKSLDVMEKSLDKNNWKAADSILHGTGVLSTKDTTSVQLPVQIVFDIRIGSEDSPPTIDVSV
jgi:hypothetical protein